MHMLERGEDPEFVFCDRPADRGDVILPGKRLLGIGRHGFSIGKRALSDASALVKRGIAVPFVCAMLGRDYDRAGGGSACVGVLICGAHLELLNPIGRKILQEAANQVVGVVATIDRSSLFRPELPPVETAVMRALVGSEGSTGSVPGTRKAMLAKLRAASGSVSRS